MAKDLQEGIKYAMALLENPAKVRQRVRAAVERLASLPQVDPNRIGVMGYCMGGTCSLEIARDGAAGVRGIVSFHGTLATQLPAVAGKVKAKVIASTDQDTIHRVIHQSVEVGSILHTDEFAAYRGLEGLFFAHETVNHGAAEFVRDGVTTNGIESVFAVLKRGLIGVYHHASPKHLHRYVDEFAFRLNEGNVERHTLDRLESFVAGTAGKRLTYKAYIQ